MKKRRITKRIETVLSDDKPLITREVLANGTVKEVHTYLSGTFIYYRDAEKLKPQVESRQPLACG